MKLNCRSRQNFGLPNFCEPEQEMFLQPSPTRHWLMEKYMTFQIRSRKNINKS